MRQLYTRAKSPMPWKLPTAYNLKYDRGNVVGLPRQRFLLTGAYQLPFGTGRPANSSGRDS